MRYYEPDNVIYPNHTAMTYGDVRRSDALNRKNHYGISYDELRRLCARHKRARAAGDIRTMEKIEYRLTDINFHHECGLLHAGDYDTIKKEMEDKIMSKYQEMKEKARNEAIDWQYNAANENYSYGELAAWCAHFERLGRRYGLLREFRENGIC